MKEAAYLFVCTNWQLPAHASHRLLPRVTPFGKRKIRRTQRSGPPGKQKNVAKRLAEQTHCRRSLHRGTPAFIPTSGAPFVSRDFPDFRENISLVPGKQVPVAFCGRLVKVLRRESDTHLPGEREEVVWSRSGEEDLLPQAQTIALGAPHLVELTVVVGGAQAVLHHLPGTTHTSATPIPTTPSPATP